MIRTDQARRAVFDVRSHPAIRRIVHWGSPGGVAVAVEQEARAPRFKSDNGWIVTDRFLLQSTFFDFDLLRLADLQAAYKWVTKQRTAHSFFVPHKRYYAVLICTDGIATLRADEKEVDAILNFAVAHGPIDRPGATKEEEASYSSVMHIVSAAIVFGGAGWIDPKLVADLTGRSDPVTTDSLGEQLMFDWLGRGGIVGLIAFAGAAWLTFGIRKMWKERDERRRGVMTPAAQGLLG